MLFIVDFDGTLSPHDTVDGLLEGIAHYPFDDFCDVLAEVRRWNAGPAASLP